MPYFTTKPLPDGDTSILIENLPSEVVEMMNTRRDFLLENILEDESLSPKIHRSRSKNLVVISGMRLRRATEEEIALLYYLHTEENETEEWFDDLNDTERTHYGEGSVIEQGNAEYAVISDDNVEIAFDNAIDDYVDEFVLPKIPAAYSRYFDLEAFTKDCHHDGLGHTLSSYDGGDNEVTIDGKLWHVFRLN